MFSGWDNFYLLVGSAAGALIGLLFIVVTLTANMDARMRPRGAKVYLDSDRLPFRDCRGCQRDFRGARTTRARSSNHSRRLRCSGFCLFGTDHNPDVVERLGESAGPIRQVLLRSFPSHQLSGTRGCGGFRVVCARGRTLRGWRDHARAVADGNSQRLGSCHFHRPQRATTGR